MKVGIAVYPADFAMRPDDLARAVEQRGFESLLFAEHTHLPATPTTRELIEATLQSEPTPPYAHTYDLFVALTFAAAATTRLLVGSGVCLVPQREPIATAKAVASLDALSGGRVLFGVGAGWIPEETANHGVVPRQRWSVMNERVEAMRRLWTEDKTEFHGAHVDFGSIWSWPKPHQRPHPPILVGGEGEGVLRRVLAYGDEWMPEGRSPVERLAERIAELQTAAQAAGRDRIPVTVFGPPPRLEAVRRLGEIGVGRVVLKAPTGNAETVERFLDEVEPLIGAVADQ